MRRPYPQYWLLAALFVSAATVAFYWKLPHQFVTAFPDPMTRTVCGVVLALFLWMFFRYGATAASELEENGYALAIFAEGGRVPEVMASTFLLEASNLRARGVKVGQSDFTLLHEKIDEKFATSITRATNHIDTVLLFLFFVGMFFTVVGIVTGFAFNKPPTNPEESKLMSFAIIKALGLAYAISGTCLGSAVTLYGLSAFLKAHAHTVQTMFTDALYEVAILNAPVSSSVTSPVPAHEASHEVKTV